MKIYHQAGSPDGKFIKIKWDELREITADGTDVVAEINNFASQDASWEGPTFFERDGVNVTMVTLNVAVAPNKGKKSANLQITT